MTARCYISDVLAFSDGPEPASVIVPPVDSVVDLYRVLRLASQQAGLKAAVPSMTHDLRDSLNALTANVELVAQTMQPASRPDDEDAQRRSLQALRGEIGRVGRSIERVLDEVRDEPEEFSSVSIDDLVRSAVSLVGAAARSQAVRLHYDRAASTSLVVPGRILELRQALLCVVLNALEAMPVGGDLTINARIDAGQVVVSVSDTGPGIAPELEPFIWHLFFSTRASGRGVGLFVARSIAMAHGGTLTLDRYENGSEFSLRLPLPH